MTSFGSLTMSLCGFFGETLINVNNEKIDGDGFFPFEVAKNTILYCNYILYTLPVCAALTLLLIFQFKAEEEKKDEISEGLSTPNTEVSDKPLLCSEEKSHYNINNTTSTIQEIEDVREINENNKSRPIIENQIEMIPEYFPNPPLVNNPKSKQSNLAKVLIDRRIWILALLNYLSLFSLICVGNTYRVIATIKKYDINIPKYTNLISGVIVIIIGPLWGFLSDKFSYKSLYIIINAFVVITCCSIYFTFEYPILYSCLYICTKILIIGYLMIKTPYIMKIFSIKYFMEVGAMISVVSGFNQIISSIFNYYISNWATSSNSNLPYLYGFCGVSILNVIGIVVGYFNLSNDPFNYENEIILKPEKQADNQIEAKESKEDNQN